VRPFLIEEGETEGEDEELATQRRRRRAAARRERLGRRSAWGTGTGWRKKRVLTGGPRASVREREERGELGWCARERKSWAAVLGPGDVSGEESAGWTGPRALVWAGGKEREGLGPRWVLGPG